MSELKAYIAPTPDGTGLADYYLKSEADKVIAEKDKEIAELKDKLQNVSELLTDARGWLIESQKMHKRCADNAIKQLRHHKYKRCLAMKYVEWLKQIIIGLHPESILYRKAFKRERKWKELADKFKEAK